MSDPALKAPANDSAVDAASTEGPSRDAAWGPDQARETEKSASARPAMDAMRKSFRGAPPKAHGLPSRKVLMSGAIILGGLLAFAVVTGLSPKERRREPAEERAFRAATPPESVRAGPATYADLGLIGAGLDLSPSDQSEAHPILEPPSDPQFAEAPGSDLGIAGKGVPPASASVANFNAAGTGRVPGARRQGGAGANSFGDDATADDGDAAARTSPIAFGGASQGGDRGYGSMGSRNPKDAMVSASRLQAPSSIYLLQAGSVIPAALRTALNSDAPGRVVAQVIAPVYDSVRGEFLLIPQGARLIGTYENGVRYGDKRIRIVWNRLILPNGYSIDLEEMAAADQSGAAGLSARVDDHIPRVAAASVISGALSTAANAAQDRDSSIFVQSIGDAAAQEAARVGGRIVDRELDVRPTLRVPAGAKVNVLIERDVVLRVSGR